MHTTYFLTSAWFGKGGEVEQEESEIESIQIQTVVNMIPEQTREL